MSLQKHAEKFIHIDDVHDLLGMVHLLTQIADDKLDQHPKQLVQRIAEYYHKEERGLLAKEGVYLDKDDLEELAERWDFR